ncbi:MAG TPA: CidA/LrgA family protein [Candidatus Elarobacter sp.]
MASERALPRPGLPAIERLSFGRWTTTIGDAIRLLLQVAALWAFSAGGGALQNLFHLPLPGNVIGMCALFAALVGGVIRIEWFELGGGFLTKHLAFFFVPVTVGVMGFGPTFVRSGLGIVVALLVSTVAGLAVAGLTTQALARRR